MKIKVAYVPGEGLIADMVVMTIRKLLPNCKVRTSQLHPPITHIYIETPKPKNN
jgi:hypothetical protein